MGCKPSKQSRGHADKDNNNKTEDDAKSHVQPTTIKRQDEEFVNVFFRDLRESPELFVLNNMLMSVQFFQNYQRDVRMSHSEGIKLDKERNKVLLKDESMECVCPDVIIDKINANIRYKPHHGPKKLISEGLVTKRLYVINDRIDVINSMDNMPQYTSIDKPSYQVRIEECNKKGFVKLKFIDSTKIPSLNGSIEHLENDFSPASMYSDLDYTTISELRTPKLLDVLHGVSQRRDSIPRSYFTQRKLRRRLSESTSYDDPSDETLFETVTYLDTVAFMSDFEKSLFPNSLGEALGFDETEISRATSIHGKIFCYMLDEDDSDSFIPCEIIPGVSIDWPAEQAFEFQMREDRPTNTDPRTGQKYKWPLDSMIHEITQMSCVLVPKGYSLHSNLEWEIAFPKAERYLESRMTQNQIRCMLFLMLIHKTYIEPVTRQNGLLIEHIRCHMYWECERNHRDWSEFRVGFKVKEVIESLIKKLSRNEMPDYFIRQKNVFANIPKKNLRYAQERLHDVVYAPVMHFIKALRNIEYPDQRFKDDPELAKDFYWNLDWQQLYNILINTDALEILNPKVKEPMLMKHRRFADRDTQWNHLYYMKKKQERNKKKLVEQKSKDQDSRRASVDSIDIKWMCDKQFDVFKVKALVDVFIINFIKMAEIASRISTRDIAQFYIKQAWYLTRILDKTSPSLGPDAMEYREQIKDLDTAIKKKVARIDSMKTTSDIPPVTPPRNSMQFDFTPVSASSKVSRPMSGNYTKNTVTFEKSVTEMKVSPSLKIASSSNRSATRKSISFVDPPK